MRKFLLPFLGLKTQKDKKPGTTTTTGEAIQKLREQEEMLVKKQEFLESKIQQEIATAKKNGHKNKRAALQALKRKKRYEMQLQQTDGTLSTIEMQREALEGTNTNAAVLNTMGEAAKALRTAQQHMNVDKIHDVMDDIAEQQDIAREISDAISNPIGFGQDIDEDELERELELLEQEELDEALLSVGSGSNTTTTTTAEPPPRPSVPRPPAQAGSGGVPKKGPQPQPQGGRAPDTDDDDMKELAAWAS